MADPARRTGFSRRAQYGLFAGYVTAIGGLVFGLLLALTARFDPDGHAAVQGAISDLTSPITTAGRSTVGGFGALAGGVAAYVEAGSKNRAMEGELRGARTRLIEAQALSVENARLKRLVGLVEPPLVPIVAARLVSSTGASTRRYATLSAGSLQGVAAGQPVRAPDGLVGRVVAAGRVSARVLLITDGGNVVPVKRIGDGMPALATGRGDGTLEVRALESSGNPFRPGDVFVSSGAGGVYPPDIPVARAARSSREATVARPFADPGRLDFAIVLPPFVVAPIADPNAKPVSALP